MLCIGCGIELPSEPRFCHACGTRQTRNCASCAAELPPDARFCGACGAKVEALPSAKRDLSRRAMLGADADRRQLTVLFCDLAGSTEMSRALDVEDFRSLVNQYHLTAARQVERLGGHVAQYLGDGVLAYFGWPQVH